jgi:hypothetical protein
MFVLLKIKDICFFRRSIYYYVNEVGYQRQQRGFGILGDGMVSIINRYIIGELNNMVQVALVVGRICFLILRRLLGGKLNMPPHGGLAFESCCLIRLLECKFD